MINCCMPVLCMYIRLYLLYLGLSTWPPGCSLKFIIGYQLGNTERVMVEALGPGVEYDISVPMTSPKTPGMYHGQWRMSTPTGTLFGGRCNDYIS